MFSSPNYPDFYPRKKDCVWHFTTTPGHRIRLHFTAFEMEPHQVNIRSKDLFIISDLNLNFNCNLFFKGMRLRSHCYL